MWPRPKPTFVPSGILIHPATWSQHTWAEIWRVCPLAVELGPHLTQCCLGWGPPQHRIKWHLDTRTCLATTDMGWKLGALAIFGGGGAGSHLTQCIQLYSPYIWQQFNHKSTINKAANRTRPQDKYIKSYWLQCHTLTMHVQYCQTENKYSKSALRSDT